MGESFEDDVSAGMSWIDGSPVLGEGALFSLADPTNGEVTSTYRSASPEQVVQATMRAQAAFSDWGQCEALDRSRVLFDVAAAIGAASDELATLETTTTGKPIRDTRIEVDKCREMFLHYAGAASQITGRTIPVPSPWFAIAERVPLGVLAVYTPWNAPLFTACWNTAAALACGNTVVIKPSEYTPLSTLALVRIIEASGLPTGVVNVVAGNGPETGAALIEAPHVAKVAFIGSVSVGRVVASRAAAVGVPSLLELGGKSANIVFADADLEAAALGAVTALFSNNGQSCTAGSRLMVEFPAYAEVVARVLELVEGLRVGLPTDPGTELGPISNRRQWQRVQQSIKAGVEHGAIVHGVGRPDGDLPVGGFWLMPTVMGDANVGNPIYTEEIFGPVLAVSSFTTEDEAVDQANATGFGLAGAVWTGKAERAFRVARHLQAGTVWINSYKALSPAVPFGGFGLSGWGRSSGPDVVAEYTSTRALWVSQERYRGTFPSAHTNSAASAH